MILVTGATGFLGGHVVRQLLEAGAPVRVMARHEPNSELFDYRQVEFCHGDLNDPASLAPAFAGARRLIHIAGLVDFSPQAGEALTRTNVVGVRHLYTEAQRHGLEKIVHVSSCSTIGGTRDVSVPMTEADFGKGTGTDFPYPKSKRQGEEVALDFAAAGLPITIVNPTFFAGPGDVKLSSARTIVSFLRGQVWVGLTRGGMGYTDVRDVAAGVLSALERGRVGERYILGGTNLHLHEYHAILGELTGVRPPRFHLDPNWATRLAKISVFGHRLLGIKTHVDVGDVLLAQNYWFFDYSKARRELGMSVRSPRESLTDALAWLTDQGIVPGHRPTRPRVAAQPVDSYT